MLLKTVIEGLYRGNVSPRFQKRLPIHAADGNTATKRVMERANETTGGSKRESMKSFLTGTKSDYYGISCLYYEVLQLLLLLLLLLHIRRSIPL